MTRDVFRYGYSTRNGPHVYVETPLATPEDPFHLFRVYAGTDPDSLEGRAMDTHTVATSPKYGDVTLRDVGRGFRLLTHEESRRRREADQAGSTKARAQNPDIHRWFGPAGWDCTGWWGSTEGGVFRVPLDWIDPRVDDPVRPTFTPKPERAASRLRGMIENLKARIA